MQQSISSSTFVHEARGHDMYGINYVVECISTAEEDVELTVAATVVTLQGPTTRFKYSLFSLRTACGIFHISRVRGPQYSLAVNEGGPRPLHHSYKMHVLFTDKHRHSIKNTGTAVQVVCLSPLAHSLHSPVASIRQR